MSGIHNLMYVLVDCGGGAFENLGEAGGCCIGVELMLRHRFAS